MSAISCPHCTVEATAETKLQSKIAMRFACKSNMKYSLFPGTTSLDFGDQMNTNMSNMARHRSQVNDVHNMFKYGSCCK